MAAEALPYAPVVETAPGKRISWPAVFGGTLVALATELLFGAFGLFIGFTMSRGAGLEWGKAWYFVTAFVALLIGGWVAARLSVNTYGSGRLHGAVTWGLTTLATFMIAVWMSWGALSTSIAALRTAGTLNGDASTLFLVIFGGIVAGCIGALLGGGMGSGIRGVRPAVATRTPTPMERAS
jgi:hypothetical protein